MHLDPAKQEGRTGLPLSAVPRGLGRTSVPRQGWLEIFNLTQPAKWIHSPGLPVPRDSFEKSPLRGKNLWKTECRSHGDVPSSTV